MFLCQGGGKVKVQVDLMACRFLKAPQHNSTQRLPAREQSFQRGSANRKSPKSTGSDTKSSKHALLHRSLFSGVLLVSSTPDLRFQLASGSLECGLWSVSSVGLLTGSVWWHTSNVAR